MCDVLCFAYVAIKALAETSSAVAQLEPGSLYKQHKSSGLSDLQVVSGLKASVLPFSLRTVRGQNERDLSPKGSVVPGM